jgi:predicted enzyme related to lactoylglutathione lyase
LFKKDKTAPHPVIVINVRSIDVYMKKIKEAKGKVVMPKMAVGDMGFYARIKDTEGNIIGIWENKKK